MRTLVTSTLVGATLVMGAIQVGTSPAGAVDQECQGRPATIVGTNGDDWILVDHEDAVVVLLDGDDTVFLLGGDDNFVCGGDGDDWAVGSPGDDRIYGEDGDDSIFGMAGDDMLVGGDGDDELYGNDDSDTLFGGAGFDHIDGGQGGTGPGDYCEDMADAVIGANFYNCESYGTYFGGRSVPGLPGTANPFVMKAPTQSGSGGQVVQGVAGYSVG